MIKFSGRNLKNTFLRTRWPQRLNHCVTPRQLTILSPLLFIHGNDAAAIDAERNKRPNSASKKLSSYSV